MVSVIFELDIPESTPEGAPRMAELKTKPTTKSVAKFLDAIPDADRRADCRKIAEMMTKATRAEPVIWGTAIVGFGKYRYVYASGREGDWFKVGFSPRKKDISVYLMSGVKHHAELLEKLGKHKIGGGCLYINKLEDIDFAVLTKIVKACVAKLQS
jgi:hypothetical protein